MKLSKKTIVEMLMWQSNDLECFIADMNMPHLGKDLLEINSPVKLLIAWLSEEISNDIKKII